MFEAFAECWSWDLADEGVDAVLDRLKGEIGLTGLVVPVVVPALCQVRARPGARPRVFLTGGGAMFRAESRYFAGTRLRPVAAEGLRRSDSPARAAQACAGYGLRFRPAVHACHDTAAAERFPAAAVRDVFGEPVPGRLCPVNPDVREYLRGLVENVAALCPQTDLELREAAFPHDRFADRIPTAGLPLSPLCRQLWSLCFCDSCQHLAGRDGLDVAGAARAVTAALERLYEDAGALPSTAEAWIAEHPPLAAFLEWRTVRITALHEVLAGSAGGRLIARASGPSRWTGFDPRSVGRTAVVCVEVARTAVTAVEQAIGQAGLESGAGRGLELSFVEALAGCQDPSALVASVARAAELGARGATLGNIGLLPPSRLDWLRQAVRYASRQRQDGPVRSQRSVGEEDKPAGLAG